MAKRIQDVTGEDATVATGSAGALPYFSGRRGIDLLGKCDPRIARLEAHYTRPARPMTFHPGHNKWDPAYSIGELRPDAVAYVWRSWDLALPYLDRDYVRLGEGAQVLFLRRDSRRVRWDRVEQERKRLAREGG